LKENNIWEKIDLGKKRKRTYFEEIENKIIT